MIINVNCTITQQEMPWGGEPCVDVRYQGDSQFGFNGYRCIVVKDSYTSPSDRLTTMIVRFPRYILAEMNTHRVFSRNSASSRARSLKTTITSVLDDPVIPIFTTNHKGMSGPIIGPGERYAKARVEWLRARDAAVVSALRLLLGPMYDSMASPRENLYRYYEQYYHCDSTIPEDIPNVHKQAVNRILEPFMWHEAIITSSYWNNFFELRTASGAAPEMQAIAKIMQAAYRASTDLQLAERRFHIPFTEQLDDDCTWQELFRALMDSAAECARVSYVDKTAGEKQDNTALSRKLLAARHMSPFEHQAIHIDALDRLGLPEGLNGNLDRHWVQSRKLMELGYFNQWGN